MPDQNPAVSPFETITSKKSGRGGKKGIVIAIVIAVFLILGVVAGVLLVQQQQNIKEKAAENLCPAAEACPLAGQQDILRDCSPGNADGSPQEYKCSNIGNVGQIYACGAGRFCCPSLGALWTTDLTSCTAASPSPTATAEATVSPTASASATPTSTATASATPKLKVLSTPREVPVTGTDWPTILGVGLGGAAIIGAILLAI